MTLRFTKMHGCGNDYILVDAFDKAPAHPSSLARRLSDRHFGVGGDGLVLIAPPEDPRDDCRMEMYNADGSRAQMCGNGIRCVARFLHDRRMARQRDLRVETDAGVKRLHLLVSGSGEVEGVQVDMGAPGLARRDLPVVDGVNPEEAAIDLPLEVAGHRFRMTAVSMGNPHAVVRVDEAGGAAYPPLETLPLETWGPSLESHPWFPERTNAEFAAFRSRREIDVRVWERGSGETLACGTGACAVVVAGVLNGWCERRALVHLRGGDLEIEWRGQGWDDPVLMTGPAVEVFRGEWPEEGE